MAQVDTHQCSGQKPKHHPDSFFYFIAVAVVIYYYYYFIALPSTRESDQQHL